MASKPISQREAQRLKKRVKELEREKEQRRNHYARDYPGGIHLGTLTFAEEIYEWVRVSRLLGHPVVAVDVGNRNVRLYAVKP